MSTGAGPLGHWSPYHHGRRSYMFPVMYWPLIGGFIALVLVSLLMGWVMDTHRRRDSH